MPLPKAAARKLLHTREIRCCGYERDDGLWDIEGVITDVKSYSFETIDRGLVPAGVPIHEMHVRLTVDDDLKVVDIEASSELTPFKICPQIAGGVKKLIGARVASGWTRLVQERIGGVAGCTHIMQLILGPLATTVYQTIYPAMAKRKRDAGIPEDNQSKPGWLDSCHGWSSSEDMVKERFPKFYKPREETPA
jgi:hypothetical protein